MAYNLLSGWTLDIAANKSATINFNASGAWGGESVSTQPTVTKIRSIKPAFMGASISVFGEAFKLLSATFDSKQSFAQHLDVTSPNGIGATEILDRKIGVKIKFYADPVLSDLSKHPAAFFRAAAEGPLSLSFGINQKITISSTRFQITKPLIGNEGGIYTFDCDGQLNGNDIVISVTRATA
jgi:hypothetical protein